jgi:general secretion pathway protein G
MNLTRLNRRMGMNRRGGAFTLIELLLVMVIITILATILVPRVVGHLEKAKITKAQADLSTLKTSLN